ncbi:hypothetical protein PRZ48_008888 [Zasmidium cellare]|uniref:Uncharacterized protein n=1 Tax=Zasmidium cellare TaxID=395010 RepID=A0ABR0EH50_ZASCE|nr:hypothetical protein PRZ48_008888 [Zasmidium cellare]
MRVAACAWALLTLTWPVNTQTPDGFAIQSRLPLRVTFNPSGGHVTPGMLVSINATVIPPTLYAPTSITNVTTHSYLAMMIDEAVPLLHCFQQDLVQASSINSTLQPSPGSRSQGIITPYVRPQPLRGQGPQPYVILLLSQPNNWTIPSNYSDIIDPKSLTGVVNFNVTDFVQASGLSRRLAGATWFREDNTTSAGSNSSSTSSPATVTASASSAVYTGSAHALEVVVSHAIVFGALGVLASVI